MKSVGRKSAIDNRLSTSEVEMETVGVDFGTYHHSSPEESSILRSRAQAAFELLMKDLYPAEAPLQILDAGCGLGFLMHVAADCFPEAHITGVDLFTHESVPEMSMARAISNMELLGIHARTSLLMHDLTKPLDRDGKYDLVISNVVFHNMGRKRFTAYRSVLSALKPNAFFILGDLFCEDGADVNYLSEHATLLKEIGEEQFGKWIYKILVLRTHDAVGKSEYGTESSLQVSY